MEFVPTNELGIQMVYIEGKLIDCIEIKHPISCNLPQSAKRQQLEIYTRG